MCSISQLCELFPDIPTKEIEKAIQNYGGNVDVATTSLLNCKIYVTDQCNVSNFLNLS
jgi:hypothetical protein